MAQKAIQGSEILARQIRARRNELGLTIEEAASRANVGTKTWSRYEAGESIRMDKCKGICRALNWHTLPEEQGEENEGLSIQEYKNHEAWSEFLANVFGDGAAMAFAAGSDILLDHVREDMAELASMPAGSHIGQLSMSWLRGDLPEQFLTHYDYEFLYQLKCTLCELRTRAGNGASMEAHSVMEELVLYLCNEESIALVELCGVKDETEKKEKHEMKGNHQMEETHEMEDWVFDLFDDTDILQFLYSDVYLKPNHPYHFSHWSDQQFYTGTSM